ncbi:unnamed protein product [Ectocarpus fasciculatus]
MAATVIAAIVTVVAIMTMSNFVLSTEVEERNVGCFHRRVLRAVPLQSLKIVVVVWQILTQFAEVANVIYPGVYQDFLSAIDVVNFDLGSVFAAGCVWSDMDFHDRLLVVTTGPLVVVGFLAMTYGIAMRRNSAAGHHSAADKIHRETSDGSPTLDVLGILVSIVNGVPNLCMRDTRRRHRIPPGGLPYSLHGCHARGLSGVRRVHDLCLPAGHPPVVRQPFVSTSRRTGR